MINPREADEFVATAHRHYDVLRDRVDELTDRIKEGAQHMMSWKSPAPEAGDPSTGTSAATITINDVCAMVGRALRDSDVPTDPSTTVEATLTTKVAKTGKAGVNLRFAVCGVRAGAGAQRTSGNTQTVKITFDPTRTPAEAETPPAVADPNGPTEPDGSELKVELDALAATIGPGALWSSASIDLDFKFDDQAKASVIAEGDISDSSTHHLEVVLEKKK